MSNAITPLLTLVKRYLAAEAALLVAERRALPATPKYRHTRAFVEGMRYALWVVEQATDVTRHDITKHASENSKAGVNDVNGLGQKIQVRKEEVARDADD